MSNRVNDDKDFDDNKNNEPEQKLFEKKIEPTVHNNEEKEMRDDKGEGDNKDNDGSIVPSLENHYK